MGAPPEAKYFKTRKPKWESNRAFFLFVVNFLHTEYIIIRTCISFFLDVANKNDNLFDEFARG